MLWWMGGALVTTTKSSTIYFMRYSINEALDFQTLSVSGCQTSIPSDHNRMARAIVTHTSDGLPPDSKVSNERSTLPASKDNLVVKGSGVTQRLLLAGILAHKHQMLLRSTVPLEM